jgi:glutamate transport system permease protein
MTVLYDVQGPRARRKVWIVSIIAVVLVLIGLYFFVYLPLEQNGQFTAKKWDPVINPTNKQFPQVWQRLGAGLWATASAAVFAIAASLVCGSALAVLRLQLQTARRLQFAGQSPPVALLLRALTNTLNGITRVFVEVFRGLPVVITILFVARILPEWGIDVATLWYLVIGLTLYNSVVIAEILRSGMTGLPGGQREAAAALGLSPLTTIRLILLPQAYRIMLPAIISQIIVIFKDTSLGVLVAYQDLLNVAGQVKTVLSNPIQIYAAIAVIYLLINYTLSKVAVYAQRRIARGRRTPAGAGPVLPSTVMDAATDATMDQAIRAETGGPPSRP